MALRSAAYSAANADRAVKVPAESALFLTQHRLKRRFVPRQGEQSLSHLRLQLLGSRRVGRRQVLPLQAASKAHWFEAGTQHQVGLRGPGTSGST